MPNYIRINFRPCSPAPINGYRIIYRPVGSSGPYRESDDRFFTSPIDLFEPDDPTGVDYEGYIQSDCGNGIYSSGGFFQTGNNDGSASDSGGESESDGGPVTPPNWWVHGSWWDYFSINLTGPTWLVGPMTKFDYGEPLAHEGFIDWPALIAANPGVQVNVAIASDIEGMDVRIRIYDLTDSLYLYDGGGTNYFGAGFVPEVGHQYLIEAFDALDPPQHILF